MQQVMSLVERVAPSNASVLITGEHGTGKEVIARVLHAASARRGHAFVAVNAGGLSEGVLESELFGHVRGAFTDARTDRRPDIFGPNVPTRTCAIACRGDRNASGADQYRIARF